MQTSSNMFGYEIMLVFLKISNGFVYGAVGLLIITSSSATVAAHIVLKCESTYHCFASVWSVVEHNPLSSSDSEADKDVRSSGVWSEADDDCSCSVRDESFVW